MHVRLHDQALSVATFNQCTVHCGCNKFACLATCTYNCQTGNRIMSFSCILHAFLAARTYNCKSGRCILLFGCIAHACQDANKYDCYVQLMYRLIRLHSIDVFRLHASSHLRLVLQVSNLEMQTQSIDCSNSRYMLLVVFLKEDSVISSCIFGRRQPYLVAQKF